MAEDDPDEDHEAMVAEFLARAEREQPGAYAELAERHPVLTARRLRRIAERELPGLNPAEAAPLPSTDGYTERDGPPGRPAPSDKPAFALAEQQRIVWELHQAGLRDEEIARGTGKRLGTVKATLSQIRAKRRKAGLPV